MAALLVLLVHSIGRIGNSKIATFFYLENFGAIGVDIFFVISGAIMVIITKNGQMYHLTFFKKRCLRILPLYWLISFWLLFRGFVIHKTIIAPKTVWATLAIFPIVDKNDFVLPVIPVGWTLSFEFLFYFVFACCLNFKKINTAFLSAIVISLFVLIGFLFPSIKNVPFVFATNPIILEFLFGCLCGWLFIGKLKISKQLAYVILSTGLVVFMANIVFGFGNIAKMENTINSNLSVERVINWGIGSFCIVAGLLLLEKNNAFRVNHLFIVLGDCSFSLYLLHGVLLNFIVYRFKFAIFQNPDLLIVTGIVVCVVASYFVNRFIEKPLGALANKLFEKSYDNDGRGSKQERNIKVI